MGVSRPITVLLSAGQSMISSGAGRIVFTSVIETSGAASCSFGLFDGNPATQRGLLDFNLNANGSVRDPWPEHGIPFEGDLWIGNIAGVGTCRIHVVPEDVWHLWKADYWQGIETAFLNSGQVI